MARILSLPFHCDQKVWCMPPSTGDWYDWYQSPTFGTVFFDSIMQFYFALIHFWIHFFFELKFDIEGFVFVWISHVCCICPRFIYPSMVWIIKSDYSQGFILIPIRTQLLFGTVLRGPFASIPLYFPGRLKDASFSQMRAHSSSVVVSLQKASKKFTLSSVNP